MEKAPLSVLIPAKNEAANLRECMASVAFADEIVVVDSQSTDGTQEIAVAAGAAVVQFHWDGKFPRKKNWALANLPWRHEWVLIVDADERITPELEREIRNAIRRSDVDGFYLNRRFWFLGGWINHCGYFPSWNLRLFRYPLGRYERAEPCGDALSGDNEVHEHVVLKGRTEYLAAPMEHYAYPDIATFVDKHNRYSTWEAQVSETFYRSSIDGTLAARLFGSPLERKRWLKLGFRRAPFRPAIRFLYHYLWRQGFRDGYRGWVLCLLLAHYEFLCDVKQRELRRQQRL